MKSPKLSPYLWAPPLIVFLTALWLVWQHIQRQQLIVEDTERLIPSFELPTLFNPSQKMSSANLRGHVSLVNIWASWCRACRDEHATLMKIKEKSSVPIYGLNFKNNSEQAKAYLKEAGNPYVLIGRDTEGTVGGRFGMYGTPETFVVDANGIIRYHHIGTLTLSIWENTIRPVVKKYINQPVKK